MLFLFFTTNQGEKMQTLQEAIYVVAILICIASLFIKVGKEDKKDA